MRTLALVLFLLSPTFAQNEAFISIFETPSVTDKKEIFHTLTKDEKDEVRRLNYSWAIEHLELNEEKIDYLNRLSKALPTITKDEVDTYEQEALQLFEYKEGLLLFGSIGPYKPCNVFTEYQQAGNCNCSMSSYNTCSGVCGPGVCRWTEDGCGFGWLQGCNSVCVH